jgi:hypothetical protein
MTRNYAPDEYPWSDVYTVAHWDTWDLDNTRCEQCHDYKRFCDCRAICACEDPSAVGVMHRFDGPCYRVES